MRTIKAKPISHENFAAYGNFVNVLEPTGSALGTFYNDKVLLSVSRKHAYGIFTISIGQAGETTD